MLVLLCKQCKGYEYEPSQWLLKMWKLYRLQKAGYVFQPNDLTVEEWEDLYIIHDEMEARANGWRTKIKS